MVARALGIRIAALCLSAFSLESSVVQAQETSIYRWVLDDAARIDGIGGANFFLLVGPLGGTVTNTRITAEFVTADAWDVSNLHINMFGPIVQTDGSVGAELDIYGTDLGWSGVGHFYTVHDSDAFNGEIYAPGGISLWHLDLNDFGNFYFGRYLTLIIELEIVDIVADEFCPGDLDGDGVITGKDLQLFKLGECPTNGDPCVADVNYDGVVTREDREILITYVGGVCPYAP